MMKRYMIKRLFLSDNNINRQAKKTRAKRLVKYKEIRKDLSIYENTTNFDKILNEYIKYNKDVRKLEKYCGEVFNFGSPHDDFCGGYQSFGNVECIECQNFEKSIKNDIIYKDLFNLSEILNILNINKVNIKYIENEGELNYISRVCKNFGNELLKVFSKKIEVENECADNKESKKLKNLKIKEIYRCVYFLWGHILNKYNNEIIKIMLDNMKNKKIRNEVYEEYFSKDGRLGINDFNDFFNNKCNISEEYKKIVNNILNLYKD